VTECHVFQMSAACAAQDDDYVEVRRGASYWCRHAAPGVSCSEASHQWFCHACRSAAAACHTITACTCRV
jgi:hypothetical protein